MFNKYIYNNKKILQYSLITGWGVLGFKRGINSYDYRYKKYSEKYSQTDSYLYSVKISNGLLGTLLYLNPFILIVTIPKEIYRLEVNIRNIEYEKNSDYYNELL